MEKIQIVRGIEMPFFPMRPANSRVLRNRSSVEQLLDEMKDYTWVVQPKMAGDRACVGVLDGKVYIQNRHGSWYKHKVKNLEEFKKLGNHSVLDGEVFKGEFYPFECLAVSGRNLTMSTCFEREVMAMKMSQFLDIEYKFGRPSANWLLKLSDNKPMFDGVIMKRSNMPYLFLSSPHSVSLDWLKRCWV